MINPNTVIVLNADGRPLSPTRPARARWLLKRGSGPGGLPNHFRVFRQLGLCEAEPLNAADDRKTSATGPALWGWG
ncbi:MAG: hypothetical protein C4575_09845 [Desulforudis sp.]|nr:MAG: hypothetical protein C4575_09845 [Desulforudis sp.]